MATIDHNAELAKAGAHAKGWLGNSLYYVRTYPLGALGAFIVLLFVIAAVFADFIAGVDPTTTNSARSLAEPGTGNWLGADFMGRDVWSRIVHGARISLIVGIGSAALGALGGVIIGLASGYIGGWFDLIMQRIIDIMQALPLLVMALLMAASLGPSLINTVIAIAIPFIPQTARVIRANTMALREMPFVEASKAVGMSEWRIAVEHILPNTLAPVNRAGDGEAGLRHPHRSIVVVSRPRHSRTASVLGTHAVRVRRRVRAHGTLAGDLPRHRDLASGIRHQPSR